LIHQYVDDEGHDSAYHTDKCVKNPNYALLLVLEILKFILFPNVAFKALKVYRSVVLVRLVCPFYHFWDPLSRSVRFRPVLTYIIGDVLLHH